MAEWKIVREPSGHTVCWLDLEAGSTGYVERARFAAGTELEAVVGWVMENANDGDYLIGPQGELTVILDRGN